MCRQIIKAECAFVSTHRNQAHHFRQYTGHRHYIYGARRHSDHYRLVGLAYNLEGIK